jgi:hypothetical protein
MVSRLRALGLVLVMALGWGPGASAQGEALPVTPGAGAYLPAAADLGADWQEVSQTRIAPGPQLFAEGVKAVYGGPHGSPAFIYVWLARDETKMDGAWDATTEFLNAKQAQYAPQIDVARLHELARLNLPAGCTGAVRIEGLDGDQNFPAGLTLCAVAPDVIIMTIVSGTLGEDSGYLASDALLELALGAGSG